MLKENVLDEKAAKTPNGVTLPIVCHEQGGTGECCSANMHYHDYIEILYCLEGSMRVFIDGNSLLFEKGDMVVINAGEVHMIYVLSSVYRYRVVRFMPDILYTSSYPLFETKYMLAFSHPDMNRRHLFPNSVIAETEIPWLISDILSEFKEQKYGYEFAGRTNICRIFLWIIRNSDRFAAEATLGYTIGNELMQKLRRVTEYVGIHYAEYITISEMAKMCNISYSYFSKIFKVFMNKPFSEYLNYVRVSAAEKLLIDTDLSMTEIAIRTGFSTSSYFIQQFRQQKNVSPKQFRKSFLNINEK